LAEPQPTRLTPFVSSQPTNVVAMGCTTSSSSSSTPPQHAPPVSSTVAPAAMRPACTAAKSALSPNVSSGSTALASLSSTASSPHPHRRESATREQRAAYRRRQGDRWIRGTRWSITSDPAGATFFDQMPVFEQQLCLQTSVHFVPSTPPPPASRGPTANALAPGKAWSRLHSVETAHSGSASFEDGEPSQQDETAFFACVPSASPTAQQQQQQQQQQAQAASATGEDEVAPALTVDDMVAFSMQRPVLPGVTHRVSNEPASCRLPLSSSDPGQDSVVACQSHSGDTGAHGDDDIGVDCGYFSDNGDGGSFEGVSHWPQASHHDRSMPVQVSVSDLSCSSPRRKKRGSSSHILRRSGSIGSSMHLRRRPQSDAIRAVAYGNGLGELQQSRLTSSVSLPLEGVDEWEAHEFMAGCPLPQTPFRWFATPAVHR